MALSSLLIKHSFFLNWGSAATILEFVAPEAGSMCWVTSFDIGIFELGSNLSSDFIWQDYYNSKLDFRSLSFS